MDSKLEVAYFGERLGDQWLYQISAQQFQLECLSTNLAAGDSTGLRAYSGSQVTVRLVSSFPHLVDCKKVVEIGCGVGVFGLLGTHLSKPSLLVLTDGEERGGSIVEQNIQHMLKKVKDSDTQVPTFYRQLKWGDVNATRSVLDICRECTPPTDHYDIVLGCELMYFSTDVKLLIATVMSLTGGVGLFIHGHLFRGRGHEQQLIDQLAALHWSTLEVPHKDFISSEELGHHVEWYRVRPLISGPVAVMAQLAAENPTWREFNEEITYEEDEEEEEEDAQDISQSIDIFR